MVEQQQSKQSERVAGESPSLRDDLAAQRCLLTLQTFTEDRDDFARLREILADQIDDRLERFSFTWAGRRDAAAILQALTSAMLVPDTDESINFTEAQHAFIEGENLETLKVIYRAYFGRAKPIYLDSPYNTGNDFIYPDNFADPLDHYLRITEQKDGVGEYMSSAPETGGRYHSAWLSKMYPCLVMARQLLDADGVVCVSISDHEVAALKFLLNEIFGEENFIAQFVWKSRKFPDSRSTTKVSLDHEYLLAYHRSPEGLFRGSERDETKFQNPDDDPRGPEQLDAFGDTLVPSWKPKNAIWEISLRDEPQHVGARHERCLMRKRCSVPTSFLSRLRHAD